MATTLVRERSARENSDSVDGFLRALQDLVRAAPAVRALSRSAIARLIEPAAITSEIGAVKAALQRIENAAGKPNSSSSLPPSHGDAAAHMRSLVEQGVLLPSAAFSEQLGVTRQALSKAVAAHRVFFVELGAERYFPEFFANLRYERRQLEQISKILGELPGATKMQFFMTKKASLGGVAPLHALAKGRYSSVRIAATGFIER